MSHPTAETFMRGPLGEPVRNPFGDGFMRDIPRGAASLQIKTGIALKGYWGFPEWENSSSIYIPRYTRKVVSGFASGGTTYGGTNLVLTPFGSISGYDTTGGYMGQMWNYADSMFTSPSASSATLLTDTSTGNPWSGATSTLSVLRDPDYSDAYAPPYAYVISGLSANQYVEWNWSEALPAGILYPGTSNPGGIPEADYDANHDAGFWNPAPPWTDSAIRSGAASWSSSIAPYFGVYGTAHGYQSGWQIISLGGASNIIELLAVQRTLFNAVQPCWYWFGELRCNHYSIGGPYLADGTIKLLSTGAMALPGNWIEIPPATAAPTSSWPYFADMVCLFVNVGVSDVLTATGLTIRL